MTLEPVKLTVQRKDDRETREIPIGCVARDRLTQESEFEVQGAFTGGEADPVLDRSIEHGYCAIPVGDDYHERKDRDGPRSPHR